MINRIGKFKSILFLVLGFVFSFAVRANAAEGLQISPLTYEFSLSANSTQNATLTVRNNTALPVNYTLEAENFNKIDDQGAPSFDVSDVDKEIKDTLAGWITFDGGTSGVLQPSEQKKITYTITVPQNATPGGHYAGVFVKGLPVSDSDSQITVAGRVGALVLVSVDGEIVKSASFSNLIAPNIIKSVGTTKFSVQVNNTGNNYSRESVTVEIKNLFGTSDKIDLGTHIIPHNNYRTFSADWGKSIPFGKYSGIITATDDAGNSITQSFAFWACPWQVVVPAVLLIVLAVYLIIYFIKKRSK